MTGPNIAVRRRAARTQLAELHAEHAAAVRAAVDGDPAAPARVSALEADLLQELLAAPALFPPRSLGRQLAELGAEYLGALSAMDVRPGLVPDVQRTLALADRKAAS